MPHIKIAAIGAGSFVFGPSVLKEVFLEQRLSDLDLALMDVDGEAVGRMAEVGRRLARDTGLRVEVTAHTERAPALSGANFVLCSAAREAQARFATDTRLAAQYAPGHLLSEFGGVSGISYSLRQGALITELAAEMKRHCPEAWLFDVANPLPRVCQVAHEEGIRTVGFCCAALWGYRMLWRLFHGATLDYPYVQATEKWNARCGGLNHFSWLVALRDRATGRDLLPEVRERAQRGTTGEALTDELLRRTGYLTMAGDGHIMDYLEPSPLMHTRQAAGHGTAAEREKRLAELRDAAEGRRPCAELLKHSCWEKPVALVVALARGKQAEFPALNLLNAGQAPDLPRNVFVETPCRADANGIVPEKIELPATVAPLCQRAAAVTMVLVRAIRERKLALVREAVELDPTIADKAAGWAAVQACLKAHADILPTYTVDTTT